MAKFLLVFFLVQIVCLLPLGSDEDTEGALGLWTNPHFDAQTVFRSRFLAQLPTSNPRRDSHMQGDVLF